MSGGQSPGKAPSEGTISEWHRTLHYNETKKGPHDRRERAERNAHGAQRPRQNTELGEGATTQLRPRLTFAKPRLSLSTGRRALANTAQRSDPFAQQVVQTFPGIIPDCPLGLHFPIIRRVVGRPSGRRVGLKPDPQPCGQSGIMCREYEAEPVHPTLNAAPA